MKMTLPPIEIEPQDETRCGPVHCGISCKKLDKVGICVALNKLLKRENGLHWLRHPDCIKNAVKKEG